MKIKWLAANSREQTLLEGISLLLDGRSELLEFLFDPSKPRLRKRAGILREDSWCFSHGEVLLIHAALDLWSGSGHLEFWDCLETWDDKNWILFVSAISVVKNLDLTAQTRVQSTSEHPVTKKTPSF
jgi:hypothetical protein